MFYFNAKYLPALNLFAAKNDIRYYLCGIIVTPHPEKGVLLRATDGHTLMAVHDEEGYCKGRHIINNSADLIRHAKAPKRETGQRWVTWNGRNTGRLMVKWQQPGEGIPKKSSEGQELWASVSPKSGPNDAVFIDGKVADIDRVIPQKDLSHGFGMPINPAYIGRIGKAMDILGDRRASVSAYQKIGERNSVVLFKPAGGRGENLLFLVMPMAGDVSDPLPSRFLEDTKSDS